MVADLSTKLPRLRGILRPEYVPYLNTAGTVLLGWVIVCWITQLIWMILTPLTVSAIAVILICPATARWCLKQFGPNLKNILNDFVERFQPSFVDLTKYNENNILRT